MRKGAMRYDALKAFGQGKWGSAFSASKFKAMPKLGMMGYGELKYDKSGKLVSKAGSVVAEAKWEASTDWMFATPIGPMYIQLKGGAKVKAQGQATFGGDKSAPVFGGSVTLEPNIGVEGGYGIANVATIGAYGKASIPMQIAPPTKGSFKASAGVHVYLVFVVDWSHELGSFEATIWDTTGVGTQSAPDYVLKAAAAEAAGTFKEVDRSYADNTSAWNGDVAQAPAGGLATQSDDADVTFAILQESVMPNTQPIMADAGGKRVMVFQRNAPERDTLNSSQLAYSVLDGGTWSEPAPVWDTGTLDAFADLQKVGDDLYVVWQKEKTALTGDVSADADGVLEAIAEGSEVCIARFDAGAGAFADVQYVTGDDKLDMMPRLVRGAGEPQVVFVRNNGNKLDQSAGSTQVLVAKKSGSGWAESALGTAAGYVSELAAFSSGGAVEAAYATVDEDAVAGDAAGEVRLARSGAVISDTGESPSALQWQDGKLYWNTCGLVRAYDCATGQTATLNPSVSAAEEDDDSGASDDAADAESEGDSGDGADDAADEAAGPVVGANMRVLSNGSKTAVVWTEADDGADAVGVDDAEDADGAPATSVRSAVLGDDGELSGAIELAALDCGIAASDVVLHTDGSYAVVANAYDADDVHSLAYVVLGGAGSLQTMGASVYSPDDGQALVTYGFQNNSEQPVEGYAVTVKSGSKVVLQQAVDAAVAPGASDVGELSVDLPAGVGASSVTVEVAPAASGDERAAATAQAEVTTDADLQALVEDASDSGAGSGNGGNSGNSGSGNGGAFNSGSGSSSGASAAAKAPKVVKGKSYKASGMTYKVTSVATASKAGAVALARAKNAAKVSVPAAVKLADGRSYKVTAVAKDAFKGLAKVKTVVLGKNVATVAGGAFQNLKKLSHVTFGTAVKKVSKGAFKNTPKLAKITVKGKKLKKKSAVKGMLKGSKLKKALTVKVPKSQRKTCKASFTKANLGSPKKVVVK